MNSTQALLTIRPELLSLTAEQMTALTPWAILMCGTILAMLFSVIFRSAPKWPVALVAMASSALAAGVFASHVGLEPQSLFNNMLAVDGFSRLFGALFCAAAFFTALSSLKYLDREALQHPEYYILLLFAAFGMMTMAAAQDLIVIFIALEIMSLSVYILTGFRRSDRRSNEAAMKYFVLGSAASAVFLYGGAFLYGATGSLNITRILQWSLQSQGPISALFVLGAAMLLFGFLLKVAAVPFHMWMPDVYEGAPTPVTGFMTTGIKAASFAAFVRVLSHLGFGQGLAETLNAHLHDLLWVTAVLTMFIGNVIALTQVNLKRMLAYSSIAHTGYLLVGMLAAPATEAGYGCFHVLGCLHGDEPGCVRPSWGHLQASRLKYQSSRSLGACSSKSVACFCDVGLFAFNGWDSSHCRFCRQIFDALLGRSGRRDLAHRHCGALQRDFSVLLPESARLHVHEGTRAGGGS